METGVERRAARRFSMMLPSRFVLRRETAFRKSRAKRATSAFAASTFWWRQPSKQAVQSSLFSHFLQQITLAGDVHIRCYARSAAR